MGFATMVSAKNREGFERAWTEEIGNMRLLCQSLPQGQVALDFLELCKKLEGYVTVAAEDTYGNKDYAKVLAKKMVNDFSVLKAADAVTKCFYDQASALGDPKKSRLFFSIVKKDVEQRIATIESCAEAEAKARERESKECTGEK